MLARFYKSVPADTDRPRCVAENAITGGALPAKIIDIYFDNLKRCMIMYTRQYSSFLWPIISGLCGLRMEVSNATTSTGWHQKKLLQVEE